MIFKKSINHLHVFFFVFAVTASFSLLSAQTKDKKKENEQNPYVTTMFIDAKKEQITGNLDIAAEKYNQVIQKDPTHAPSYYELARIRLYQQNDRDALEMSKKAVELDPENKWYQLLLAEAYQQNRDFQSLCKVWEAMLKNNPDNIDYRYQLAMSHIYSEKYQDAIQQYDLIEEKIGVTEEISVQKQKLYQLLNKTGKAVSELRKLIQAYPDESRYYGMLAEFFILNNMPEEAYQVYLEIASRFPEDPYIHISLADYYRNKGEDAKSFEELKKGFESPTLDIDTKIKILISYYAITEIYENLKDDAMALAAILVETHPNDAKSYSILADFLVRDARYEEAREAFRKVIELDDSKYIVWENLLRLEAELNDFSSMANESHQMLKLFPNQPLGYLFNGVANIQIRNQAEAIKVLKRGINYVVDNDQLLSQFYSYLGDAYHQLADIPSSDAAYEKVLLLDPDNSYVLNNYAYYLSLRGEKLDKAELMAQKAVQLDPENSANLDTYGWVLYKLKKYPEARQWLEKALTEGGSSSPVILEHYGDVLYKLGENKEALEYWQKARKAGQGSEFLEQKIVEGKLFE